MTESIRVSMTADGARFDSAAGPVAHYVTRRPADSPLPAHVRSMCYFHPLRTPSGVVATDIAPPDHRHHRGVFFTWVEMRGNVAADFWGWGEFAPTEGRQIVNAGLEPRGDGLIARNRWEADGQTLVHETCTARCLTESQANILDLTYELLATQPIDLPRWAFSGFCARATREGEMTVYNPDGIVTLPDPHHMQPESDWPARPWYALEMTLPGAARVGLAVIDHAGNPPALWHCPRGVRMLNPCIVAPGPQRLTPDRAMTLRYRVVAFDGPTPAGLLNRLANW